MGESAVAVPVTPGVASHSNPSPEREAFELDLRKAKVFAASTLVPAAYQDNIANCMIALNMARRIGADPLMVAQNLYVVQGKPGWSGQFLIATFNQCGRFTSMKFEWEGKPTSKDWSCRAYATEKTTGEKIVGAWVTWKMVEAEGWSKKAGSKWNTMPEVMATYRAGAFLVRAYAPEIAMGLQTIEEIRDVIDVEVQPEATNKTDAVAAVLKAKRAKTLKAEPQEPGLVFTYAQVRSALEESLDAPEEGFLLAREMIPGVPDLGQQAELEDVANRIAHQRADRKAAQE